MTRTDRATDKSLREQSIENGRCTIELTAAPQGAWNSTKREISCLPALRELLAAANRHYLEFLSTIDAPRNGRGKLDKLSRPQHHEGRSYPEFNFFDSKDDALFRAIARGEFNIAGLQNKTVRRYLSGKSSAQVSRLLKRLRLHGLIRKVARGYKYYLTQFENKSSPRGSNSANSSSSPNSPSATLLDSKIS